MANELEMTVTLKYTPSATNQVAIEPAKFTNTVTMTGADHLQGTQNVGTSWEVLSVGEIATRGFNLIKNLDSTNYVEISSDDAPTNAPIRLNAGEFCLFRAGQVNANLRGRANTAAVNIQFWFFEA
jgi:hypothetical protein